LLTIDVGTLCKRRLHVIMHLLKTLAQRQLAFISGIFVYSNPEGKAQSLVQVLIYLRPSLSSPAACKPLAAAWTSITLLTSSDRIEIILAVMTKPDLRISGRQDLPEYITEFVVITISLGLYAFIKLTGNVVHGTTAGFDHQLLLMLRNPADIADPLGPEWLEVVVRDVTALGGVVTLGMLTIAVCGYFWLQQKPRMALFVMLSIAGGSLFNSLLKEIFERPRPDLVPHSTAAAMSSFPSGHAMMSAVVYLTLGALLAHASSKLSIKLYILGWSIVLTIMVGVSRVYLGVHWPTDIIAGWIAGGIWALLSLLASRWLMSNSSSI
jgi:undecaprenyl-diphosphatase